MIVLDTNVLARVTDRAHAHCAVARAAIHKLVLVERLIVLPQSLFEFWTVATRTRGARPDGQNGLGMSVEQAAQWCAFFARRFTLLPDRIELTGTWQELVRRKGVKGYRGHDARIVAAMHCYGIRRLLTFNGSDFGDFEIAVVDPATA